MPPLPRLTGAETIRRLSRDGWFLSRVAGSHHVLRHPTKPGRVTVPVHGSTIVKPGTMGSIIRQAGLTVAEFLSL
jgi:predicted RNA binding protein YcfA (HicA-like mRNA interferase family)